MKRTGVIHLVLIAVTLVASSPAVAFDLGGGNVLLPAAGRVPGGFGTQWQTDLVVTNLEPQQVVISLTLYESAEQTSRQAAIPSFGTLVLDDVIRTTFEREAALGMIRVSSVTENARFVARAYVYNRGNPAGEFGQGIPGFPIDSLTRDHVLSGVASSDASRTNVGVANPWPIEVEVLLTVLNAGGREIRNERRTLPPMSVVQINDVFGMLNIPPARDASIRVSSSAGIYPYASVVRNDTGDAIFVPGSGVRLASTALTPACAEPAPLLLPLRGAQESRESFVRLRTGTQRDHVMNVLVPKYALEILEYVESVPGFRSELTPGQIRGLRCESVVSLIRRDGVVPQG